jgi:hypothetical protein
MPCLGAEPIRKPGEYQGHYIDYHGNYHIDSGGRTAKGQWITSAFDISTREPGIYYLKVCIIAEGVDGEAEGTPGANGLRIRVENPVRYLMRCTDHKNCIIKPLPIIH